MSLKFIGSTFVLVALTALVGCSSEPYRPALEAQCRSGLHTAYDELSFAKANGFGGTVDYTKAAALLSAAKIQQQFDEYDNCVEKVETARRYIRESWQAH